MPVEESKNRLIWGGFTVKVRYMAINSAKAKAAAGNQGRILFESAAITLEETQKPRAANAAKPRISAHA